MPVEVTIVVRFEAEPDEQEVRASIEDTFEDAITMAYDTEGV